MWKVFVRTLLMKFRLSVRKMSVFQYSFVTTFSLSARLFIQTWDNISLKGVHTNTLITLRNDVQTQTKRVTEEKTGPQSQLKSRRQGLVTPHRHGYIETDTPVTQNNQSQGNRIGSGVILVTSIYCDQIVFSQLKSTSKERHS